MAPSPSKCSRPDATTTGVLPADVLYDILLPLPAKDLCRLRAVSRAWRSLLSDTQFIAAHGARHPGPLVVAGHPTPAGRRKDVRLYIMDLSGRIVKRVHVPGDAAGDKGTQVLTSQGGLVCISSDQGRRCRLLDPATGAVSTLPAGLAAEHAAHETDILQYWAAVVCGKVAATGEHKVLRVLNSMRRSSSGIIPKPLCEVLTLDGGGGHARWRGKQASPEPVSRGCVGTTSASSSAVVDGIVYFFVDDTAPHRIAEPKRIASFDLETEEWRRTLQGPQIVSSVINLWSRNHLSLAAMNGFLAVVHFVRSAFMDLWILLDSEEGLWAKHHSMHMKPSFGFGESRAHPLLLLSDGRIVIYGGTTGCLKIYDPKAGTDVNVAEIFPHIGFDLYTGNLLSLPNGAS